MWPAALETILMGSTVNVNAVQVKINVSALFFFFNDLKHPFQPNVSGLVPSSVVLTAFQVASRLFLTWAIAHSVPQVSTKISWAVYM